MQMLSLQFLVFLILIFPLSILFKWKRKYLPIWIFIISLFFYYLAGTNFFLLTVANLVINFIFNFLILKSKKRSKGYFVIALLLNVIFLATFKYWKVLLDQYLVLNSTYNWSSTIPQIELIIPLGLSYYTFKNIAHLVDIYKGKIQKLNFFKFSSYILFFPEITAGPITKPTDYYAQLHTYEYNEYKVGEIGRLLIGAILKKWVLASYLYMYVEGPFSSPELYSNTDLIISMFAYSAMIYCDFSGYTDLAILVSRLLGFKSTENFNYPYSATNFKDFWSRWHISLSSWLKDYVYIPLGGNRKGKARKYLNIFLTMIVSGLWHGAGLTFLIWGLIHALGTVFSHIFMDIKNRVKLLNSKFVRPIFSIFGWILTTLLISFSWIYFNAHDVDTAQNFINNIFNSTITDNRFVNISIISVILLIFISNLLRGRIGNVFEKFLNRRKMTIAYLIVILLALLGLALGPETVPPFIYFNF
jgi:D-alanyl-lipoteichoic acid acyltransferase DltB (MBOAT superfamily)